MISLSKSQPLNRLFLDYFYPVDNSVDNRNSAHRERAVYSFIIAYFGGCVNQNILIILEFFSCILEKNVLHYKHNNKQGKFKHAI